MSGLVIRGEDGALYHLTIPGSGSSAPEIEPYTGPTAEPTAGITRTITNSETPLTDPDGASVTFTLVDAEGRTQTQAYDTEAAAYVPGGSVTVALDSGGVWSVPLWPTSRGSGGLYYRYRVTRGGVDLAEPVVRPLPLGDGSTLQFADWQELDRW